MYYECQKTNGLTEKNNNKQKADDIPLKLFLMQTADMM